MDLSLLHLRKSAGDNNRSYWNYKHLLILMTGEQGTDTPPWLCITTFHLASLWALMWWVLRFHNMLPWRSEHSPCVFNKATLPTTASCNLINTNMPCTNYLMRTKKEKIRVVFVSKCCMLYCAFLNNNNTHTHTHTHAHTHTHIHTNYMNTQSPPQHSNTQYPRINALWKTSNRKQDI